MLSVTGGGPRGFIIGDWRVFRSSAGQMIAEHIKTNEVIRGDDEARAKMKEGLDAGYPYESPRGDLVIWPENYGWHYLIQMPDHRVIKSPGNQRIASRHLKAIREDLNASPTARLIGVYPPWTVGGPEGKGGVFSYGFTPTHFSDINHPLDFNPIEKV